MKNNPVTLRLWREEWHDVVYRWYESGRYPSFFRNIPYPAYIEQFRNYPQLINNHVMGVFIDMERDGKTIPTLVGLATLYDVAPKSGTASLGILIDERCQNQGVGLDAFLTLCGYAFNNINARRISVEFSAEDLKITRMIAEMSKLFDSQFNENSRIEDSHFYEGRRKKATFINGKYTDVLMCALFKNDHQKIMEQYYGKQ